MPFISIDVEASGPIPGLYDLLSVGVTTINFDGIQYVPGSSEAYWELKPVNGGVVKEAMAVNRLNLDQLKRDGQDPAEVAAELEAWVLKHSSKADPAVFVGYVANFDWAYINDLFIRHGFENPFGYRALDFRAMAMGVLCKPWQEIKHGQLAQEVGVSMPAPDKAHNALVDAQHQAELFCALLGRMGIRNAMFNERSFR